LVIRVPPIAAIQSTPEEKECEFPEVKQTRATANPFPPDWVIRINTRGDFGHI
jgi:hypothetical protein